MPAVDIYDQPVCYLDWYFTQPPFLIGLPRFNKVVFAMLLNFLRFLDSHMCVREFSWTSSVILRSRPRSQIRYCASAFCREDLLKGFKIKDGSNFKMEMPGLKCGAANCDFSTPDLGPEFYPTMVAHLQVLRVFHNSP